MVLLLRPHLRGPPLPLEGSLPLGRDTFLFASLARVLSQALLVTALLCLLLLGADALLLLFLPHRLLLLTLLALLVLALLLFGLLLALSGLFVVLLGLQPVVVSDEHPGGQYR